VPSTGKTNPTGPAGHDYSSVDQIFMVHTVEIPSKVMFRDSRAFGLRGASQYVEAIRRTLIFSPRSGNRWPGLTALTTGASMRPCTLTRKSAPHSH
jgi:hypothetical protein